YDGTGTPVMVFNTLNGTTGIGTSIGNVSVTKDIPPMQSFWVRVLPNLYGTPVSLDLNNSMLSHNANTIKSNRSNQLLRINLFGNNRMDQAIVHFNDQASDEFDRYDSEKMFETGNAPYIYTCSTNDTLVINGLKSTRFSTSLNIGIKIPADGLYKFDANEIELPNTTLFLKDILLDSIQDLIINNSYEFTAIKGNYGNRFLLIFERMKEAESTLGPELPSNITENESNSVNFFYANGNLTVLMEGYENPHATVNIYDLMGRIVFTQKINGASNVINLNHLSGMNIVQINAPDGVWSKKIIAIN
ncbi:MAG: T9SS type A sorting domain-containing protein, partial [Bacteroidetes bacterium]|nr:T9SS type A sorting domain-containing protein [Bacteroidota bacterium]